MKWLLTVFGVMPLLLACSKAPDPTPPVVQAIQHTVAWQKPDGANIASIFEAAKSANKPVFLYWGAVWCPPCNQIKATVFNRQDFIELSKMFVPVYLDGDTQGAQKLGAQFKVRGYPTMILFKPDGTELTRLPGEVDAAKYMEVLNLALITSSSVKESLAIALGDFAGNLSADAWRLLAYYSWDQDQAQLVPQQDLALTLHKLALACPTSQPEAARRLALKAIVAFAAGKTTLPDSKAALTTVEQILGDPSLARQNFDMLVYYGSDIVSALTLQDSPRRSTLATQWNLVLDQFATDGTLSIADRLTAVAAKVALAKLDEKDKSTQLSEKLLAQVRQAVTSADSSTTNVYERQAVIPNAADLLSEAGLLDESDAMLKAELPKAVSPYYHMLVLAANANTRGDKTGALAWAEKAWQESKGPATRLQWGSGYVNRLIESTPQDAKRIENAAAQVLNELEASEETFFERNRRGLEKMGQRLVAWGDNGHHAAVVKRLSTQLNAVCVKLPPASEAKAACMDVFSKQATNSKI